MGIKYLNIDAEGKNPPIFPAELYESRLYNSHKLEDLKPRKKTISP